MRVKAVLHECVAQSEVKTMGAGGWEFSGGEGE